jgi:hypothetical protein
MLLPLYTELFPIKVYLADANYSSQSAKELRITSYFTTQSP